MSNNHLITITLLTSLLVNFGLVFSGNALNIDERSKRSVFSRLELNNELVQEDLEFEVENQILSHLRQLRGDSDKGSEPFGNDDTSQESSDEIALKAELRKEYTDWKVRNEEIFQAMNDDAEIPLRRITFTSKFLWDQTNKTVKTYAEMKAYCEKYKLEMVETRNEADFATLSSFLHGNNHIVIALGANDKSQEGKFVEADGITPVGFQMFAKGEPSDTMAEKNCITLSMSPDKVDVGMYDSKCDKLNAHLICGRPRNTIVYDDSVESIGKEPEGLDIIGDTDGRRYYIGRIQKTWEEAKQYCEREKKLLLDLKANETVNQAVYRNIMIWRTQKGLSSPTGFWTSGQFENSPKDIHFIWRSIFQPFNVKTKNILWEWVKNEPLDGTKRGIEKCIDISFPSKIAPAMLPQLRVSNCDLPFYYVCYEELLPDPNCRENRPFKLTGKHSKYLFDFNDNPVTNEVAADTCQKWDYEMAEIQSLPDLIHLYNFIMENDFRERDYHLGLSDKEREGEFYEGDQRTRVSFHAFSVDQPDNDHNEDCVILKTHKGRLIMQDKNCSTTKAHVLCQFPKASSCYVNSFQNLMKPREGLIYFGETAIRRYFLSRTQKTWVESMEYCTSRNKKLLDILFIGELKHFKNQLLAPMLIQWAKKFNAGIWTSGRFARSAKDERFTWETTGETFLTNGKSMNFTWAEGEPWDTSGRNMEICIELAVNYWASAKSGTELTPILKAANCLLPNYFVCYEDAPHLKNCHLPPNVDFSFKALSETSRFIYLNVTEKLNATKRKELCQYWGLDVAEISSLRDYKLVTKALDSWNATSMYFGLGLNSVGSESMWFEGDGFTPIRFQAFGTDQPSYYHGTTPCDHVMFNKFKSPAWQMTAVPSNRLSSVLCQFNKHSSCAFQDIFNYLDRKSPKNFLKPMKDARGEIPKDVNIYFVGDSQRTWEEAMRFCWSRNKKLLDLQQTDSEQVQKIYRLLAVYLKKRNLHPSVARFWTSGKYVESYNDTQFRWESINRFLDHATAEKTLQVKMEPPQASTADNDRCVTLGLTDLEPKKKKFHATLKASNCYLPYLFVCYRPTEQPPPATSLTTTTPEPEVKHKELPPCKDPGSPEKKKMQEALQIMLMEVRPPGFLACDFDV